MDELSTPLCKLFQAKLFPIDAILESLNKSAFLLFGFVFSLPKNALSFDLFFSLSISSFHSNLWYLFPLTHLPLTIQLESFLGDVRTHTYVHSACWALNLNNHTTYYINTLGIIIILVEKVTITTSTTMYEHTHAHTTKKKLNVWNEKKTEMMI